VTENAIVVEHLSKSYLIGHRFAGSYSYNSLRDVITREARNFARKAADLAHGRQVVQGDEVEEFWALRDVSFEVKAGEVLGIIGRNGAGKSTLLKILSRITEPTEGRVTLRGRVSSLLEVGTGFHPELTGRENIYLNGAILGMTQKEIRTKFDEIVAFAEIEKFLDTPVKHYSSGMYVRLAFAVAAHLEPEILVIDEVLAVGDAQFQKKCLGKMDEVARKQGRTVLFVSHNLATVAALCTRGLLIMDGRIAYNGPVNTAIERYASESVPEYSLSFPIDPTRPCICKVDVDRKALADRDLGVDIEFASPWPLAAVGGANLRTVMGEPIWGSNSRFHRGPELKNDLHRGVIRCEARQLPLVAGEYFLSVWLSAWHQDYDSKIDAMRIQLGVNQADSLRPPPSAIGHVDWPASWSVVTPEDQEALSHAHPGALTG
jgi:lipopolysaccharide transport system ATP-binding protein